MWLESGFYVGQFGFTGFIEEEMTDCLPGWYVRDGRYYPNDTPQAAVLNAFPAGFKERNGIINNGSATCMPTAFTPDGRGLFERAGVGAKVGTKQVIDTMRPITGSITSATTGIFHTQGQHGAFYSIGEWGAGPTSGPATLVTNTIGFDSARGGEPYNGDETVPVHQNFTPIMFLGVR